LLYLLVGADEFSREEELKRIKKGLGDEDLLKINTSTLEGAKLAALELAAIVGAMPFLAENRLVLVSCLLKRFETRGERKSSLKDIDVFLQSMTALPPTTTLVLLEGEIGETNALYKKLRGVAQLRTFPLIRGTRLNNWIKERVTVQGGQITPPAVELIARLVSGNLSVADSEIAKLVLYAEGQAITEDDVSQMVGYAQQISVFNLVDAILEGHLKQAEQHLQKLLDDGASSGYLLHMITRQLRLMLRATVLLKQKTPPVEIAGKLGIYNDFVWRKTKQQAAAYNIEKLKSAYRRLLEADIAIKKGKMSQELALSLLTAELAIAV